MNDIELVRWGLGCQLFLVSSGLEKEPHHLQVSLVAGEGESGLLELVAVGVDSCSELEKNPVDSFSQICEVRAGPESSHLATVQ